MKYLKIEITDKYKVKITPTNNNDCEGQYYTTIGVITGTTCPESKKDAYLSKMIDKSLKEIEKSIKLLIEGKARLTELKSKH